MKTEKLLKRLGWSNDTLYKVEHVARNTRESLKHTVIGMRGRTGWADGNYFIQVVERPSQRVIAVSKDTDDRDMLHKCYDALIQHLELPYCCMVHKQEFAPDWGDVGLPQDEEEDDLAALFGVESSNGWGSLDDEEESWDI